MDCEEKADEPIKLLRLQIENFEREKLVFTKEIGDKNAKNKLLTADYFELKNKMERKINQEQQLENGKFLTPKSTSRP